MIRALLNYGNRTFEVQDSLKEQQTIIVNLFIAFLRFSSFLIS